MKRICLALPTNRLCAVAIAGLLEEAIFAVRHFEVEVVLLISDTSPSEVLQANALALQQAIDQQTKDCLLPAASLARLHCLHYAPAQQRTILHSICQQALAKSDEADQGYEANTSNNSNKLEKLDLAHELGGFSATRLARNVPQQHAEKLLQALLPDAVSYGAATNRLFLLAAYFGCSSLHRRDSDSRYQLYQGEKLFPIAQELRYIGIPADQAAAQVDQIIAAPCLPTYPVVLVGASYLGELSIDVAPMFARHAEAGYKIVGLFAPSHLPDAEKRRWVDDSYLHTGQTSFYQEKAELGHAHSFLIDTCNLCFSQLQEVFPLPNACNTLGSDYFLMTLMNLAGLPAVHHHRHIENFYTPERRTSQGFIEYQFRLVKFLLYMSWLHAVMQALAAEFGPNYTILRTAVLLPEHAASTALAKLYAIFACPKPAAELEQENRYKLFILQQQYQDLGDEYAAFASALEGRAEDLLNECAADYAAYAEFARAWPSLIAAAKKLGTTTSVSPMPESKQSFETIQ